jgi:DNA processing protein
VRQRAKNVVVTDAKDIPDDDEVWWRAAWATAVTPGDRIVWQAMELLGAIRALTEMWAGAEIRKVRRLADVLDVSPNEVEAFRRRYPKPPDQSVVSAVRALTRELGLSVLSPHSPQWPRRLHDLGPYQPAVLFVRGSVDFLDTAPTLGVVGSRSPSPDGLVAARVLTREATGCGYAIVSGGARGIDWVAHESASDLDARQVMVLATASNRLASWQPAMVQRVARRGAVVTETPPGCAITPASFLHRNRVIAALSDRLVVVEAAERSGSLNTASHAKTLGRDVSAVVSRPQDDKNAGCYRLIDEWGADHYRIASTISIEKATLS